MKMNSLHIALLWGFISWATVSADNDDERPDPSDEVTFHLNINAPQELSVTLQKTDTYLANENLPVWFVSDQPNELHPVTNVMRKIGRYTAYQNRDASSAAVYFHQQHEFDGIIDSRYYIRNFPIENIDDVMYVHRRGSSISGRNTPYHHNNHIRSVSAENEGDEFLNATNSTTRKLRQFLNVVFVKILLIVGPDVVASLRDEEIDVDISVTSHILTLLNSVDMLYSKIDEPKIRINIAGIIIGMEHASFPHLKSCYKIGTVEGRQQTYLEASCANLAVKTYTEKYLNTISRDSYDFVTYITSFPTRIDENKMEVTGVTTKVTKGPYELRKSRKAKFPYIIFKDTTDFATASSLAHEIAHALRFYSHYDGPAVNEEGECCSFIIGRRGSSCSNCLRWSEATLKHLKDFFSTRDRCFFINEPLTRKSRGPHEIWSADEQCQCYGYEKAGNAKRTILDKMCRMGGGGMCDLNLQCLDNNGNSHIAPFPMDGTPCEETSDDVNKVCWNYACVPVGNQ